MKKRYFVNFIKVIQYQVEAENMDEAEQIAIEMDSDKSADLDWITSPYDEIQIEEESC